MPPVSPYLSEALRRLAHYSVIQAVLLALSEGRSRGEDTRSIVLTGTDGKVFLHSCLGAGVDLVRPSEAPQAPQTAMTIDGGRVRVDSGARYIARLLRGDGYTDTDVWAQGETPEVSGFSLHRLPGVVPRRE